MPLKIASRIVPLSKYLTKWRPVEGLPDGVRWLIPSPFIRRRSSLLSAALDWVWSGGVYRRPSPQELLLSLFTCADFTASFSVFSNFSSSKGLKIITIMRIRLVWVYERACVSVRAFV